MLVLTKTYYLKVELNQTIKDHECLVAWTSGQNSSTCSTVDITSIKLEK